MKVEIVCCGPAANHSELKAIENLKAKLQSYPGEARWFFLTNLTLSITNELQSDEIDIVVIGPPGVRVIEVKHWTPGWMKTHTGLLETEADRLTRKAKKVGSTLRRVVRGLPYVDAVFLLTRDPSELKQIKGKRVRGVEFFTLADWKLVLRIDQPQKLTSLQLTKLSGALAPRPFALKEGSIRRLAGYVNLEPQSEYGEGFHRVFKGISPKRQDKVILHLYDLSASNEGKAETKARREFEALHHLQRFRWAPRILDSFQPVPGYDGEMYFFTIVDPAAPSLAERLKDEDWGSSNRLRFAREAIRALRELHEVRSDGQSIVHRNLSPHTILVKHDDSPIFTGFELAKIPTDTTIASQMRPVDVQEVLAPEVRKRGLAAADQRSDVYSLCASLKKVFTEVRDSHTICSKAADILSNGMLDNPDDRVGLDELERIFTELIGKSPRRTVEIPAARYWTEDQEVNFNGKVYRIVNRLGSGGVGTAFKVVQLDPSSGEELGAYVAKVAHDAERGKKILRAYNLARSHIAQHPALSTIFEVAPEWHENEFIALLAWIDGAPLGDFAGVFELLAEDLDEPSPEALALRWLRDMCSALAVLHAKGLVHGDVSPRNMIVSSHGLVLTDYDFVARAGTRSDAPGTILYCSPSREAGEPTSPSDDVYALAASFFHVIFDKEPFNYGNRQDKSAGLNWEGCERDRYPTLCAFLDKATHRDRTERFESALDALELLKREKISAGESIGVPETGIPARGVSHVTIPTLARPAELKEEHVEWVRWVLQSYPGSQWGNVETRGLDSDFAEQTYVGTELEEALVRDIRQRAVRLIVLCGNAGDGKTALLQHIAIRLNLGKHQSSERLLEGKISDGPMVRMNLDGSAAWKDRSADEILDEFLSPFKDGPPKQDIVHLLAINDGRLLEWIEGFEKRSGGESWLTSELYGLLQREAATTESCIRFINLNQRSLVGGISPDRKEIHTKFLDQLLDKLYGGEKSGVIWAPCRRCSAGDQCEIYRAARLFGPESVPGSMEPDIRRRARQRLFEALQAVHLKGETHITVRELRASLVYILFGIHYCDDYHSDTAIGAMPYWDRAFSAESPSRQGEVLRELAKFDPALEAHPKIDRYLRSRTPAEDEAAPPRYPNLTLASARRRACFEWTEEDIRCIAGDANALGLAHGKYLQIFKKLGLDDDSIDKSQICSKLCKGISRLENLPSKALEREPNAVVPLRITPRTPTESSFWVEKPLSNFRLEVDLPPETEGLERLHRQVRLVYRYRNGNEEYLWIGADLFHLLLELSEGYQLGDVSTDDTFAHLSIFVQRLVREDERQLLSWNPIVDEKIFMIDTTLVETKAGIRQVVRLDPIQDESGD